MIINDNIKESIVNNSPIEDNLHVITVISNTCNYKTRYQLANEFFKKMDKEQNIIMYVVELVYGNQEFSVTTSTNKRHLQIRTETAPLWHKENMINLGVKYLLPPNWKALAWVDADIEFESSHWALDTLKLLNGGKDFVQLFTHCIDMDFNKQILNTFTGFGYQYNKNFIKGNGINYWHPGFAWACNRNAYDKMGRLFQEGILGSGDNIICNTFINKAPENLKKGMSNEYINFVKQVQDKMEGITLGYIPGTIRHFFHGKKVNRKYYDREDILIKYQYNPYTFIEYNSIGLIIPTKDCPKEFLQDILDYFKGRNEDEMISDETITNVYSNIQNIYNIYNKPQEELKPIVHEEPVVVEPIPIVHQTPIVHEEPVVVEQIPIVHQNPIFHQNHIVYQNHILHNHLNHNHLNISHLPNESQIHKNQVLYQNLLYNNKLSQLHKKKSQNHLHKIFFK